MGKRRRPRIPTDAVGVAVLDSGAISKIAAGDPVARSIWRELTEQGWLTAIPAVALAEVTTGRAGHDAPTNVLVRSVGGTVACDERLAGLAGALRHAVPASTRRPSGIDAIVAALASDRQPSVVVTTDPADMTALLATTERATVVWV